MIRLIVMRHGEAVSHIGFDDKKRELTSRGKEQAKETAKRLIEAAWVPDTALVSTATRTRETFDQVRQVLGQDVPVEFIDRFYLGSLRDVVGEISERTEQTILLVGHNPGWSEMAMRLTGESVALSPAQACLLSIDEVKWGTAIHMDGQWRLESWIRTT